MRNVPGLEAVYQDFKDRGVEFFYVYKSLAHPERDGLVQPAILVERLAHIRRAKAQLDTDIPWLADSMNNDLKHALGDKNNSEFVILPNGTIHKARNWSSPEILRSDLGDLVGIPEKTTTAADLNLYTQYSAEQSKYPTGVIPGVNRPTRAEALIVKSMQTDIEGPIYLKLRAETPQNVLRSGGKGQLYLGFRLDPIHEVHWNNLAAPFTFEIQAPEGVKISPEKGKASIPEGIEADVDPREFLIDIEIGETKPSGPITVIAKYFACDDQDRWCKALTSEFQVELKTDRDGGRVTIGGGGGGNQTNRRRNMPDPVMIFSRMDSNQDGKISTSEARGPMKMRFTQADKNSDGFVTEAELKAMMDRPR